MPAYLDGSALVKRYVREVGTVEVDRLFAEDGTLLTSSIAWSECLAAFARMRHEGSLGPRRYERVREAFVTEWRALNEITMTPEIREQILDLPDAVPVRGMDAIHLASAIWAAKRLRVPVTFWCSDRKLIAAARELGLEIATPDSA